MIQRQRNIPTCRELLFSRITIAAMSSIDDVRLSNQILAFLNLCCSYSPKICSLSSFARTSTFYLQPGSLACKWWSSCVDGCKKGRCRWAYDPTRKGNEHRRQRQRGGRSISLLSLIQLLINICERSFRSIILIIVSRNLVSIIFLGHLLNITLINQTIIGREDGTHFSC